MSNELVQRMPAIIARAAANMTHARDTGELVVTGRAIRDAAKAIGFDQAISPRALRAAMIAAGASFHNRGPACAKYIFKGCLRPTEAMDRAASNIKTIKDSE